MALIDDKGRVLGVVNIVDALAVLLVITILIASVVLFAPFDGGNRTDSEVAVRYATIDVGERYPFVAELISSGDVIRFAGTAGNHTLTDVYITPTDGTNVSVTVRARVTGQETVSRGDNTSRFTLGDASFVPGRRLLIQTSEYVVSGVIRDVDTDGTELNTAKTAVVLRTTVDRTVAGSVEPGDTYRTAGRTLGTVESVTVYPTSNLTLKRMIVGISLRTIARDGGPHFKDDAVRIGTNISFSTASYRLSGRITNVGANTPPGDVETTTVTVKLEDVSPEVADDIGVGMTESNRGTVFARVTDKEVAPTTVVVESADGNVHAREHPRNKNVYLTVEVRTRRTDKRLRFHGQPLRENMNVVLAFDTITIRGKVVEIAE